jgi:hypothetical protein
MNAIFNTCIAILFLSPIAKEEKVQVLHPYGNQYCIQVALNGQNKWLIVDSGASLSLIGEQSVKAAHCRKGSTQDVKLMDIGGATRKLFSLPNCPVVLGHQALPKEDWYVFSEYKDEPFPELDNKKPVGVMGMNCLRRIKAVISYGDSVTLTYTFP